MNKKGFTLVELLAVIIVLAILVLLALPRVMSLMERSRVSSFAVEANEIAKAAQNAYGSKVLTEEEVGHPVCFTVAELVNGGYLDAEKNDVKGAIAIDLVQENNSSDHNEIVYTYLSKENYYVKKNGVAGNNKVNNGDVVKSKGSPLFGDCTTTCSATSGGASIMCGDTNIASLTPSLNDEPEPVADCDLNIGEEWTFNYTGAVAEFEAPCSGTYEMEVWGAQGGSVTDFSGGYGGYAIGRIYLNKNEKVYPVVGGTGEGATGQGRNLTGGYNGGGSVQGTGAVTHVNASGGGATHIAKTAGVLASLESNKADIIMVAGGGGGGRNQPERYSGALFGRGGSGGGFKSSGAYSNYNLDMSSSLQQNRCISTQDEGGPFGQASTITGNSAGGGGWRSGLGGDGSGCAFIGSGSGGSGYINSTLLQSGYMWCYNCEQSVAVATKTFSSDCHNETPTANCAKEGPGYAKITLKSFKTSAPYNPGCFLTAGTSWEIPYTKNINPFTAPCAGNYKLEVWGASGGSISGYRGGYGGYSVGTLNMAAGDTIYAVAGGVGPGATGQSQNLTGGYNGGGNVSAISANHINGAGGGASHIATASGLLSSLADNQDAVLLVAGGGGGGRNQSNHVSQARWGYGGSGGGFKSSGAYSNNNTTTMTKQTACISTQTTGGPFGQANSSSGNSAGGGGWRSGLGGDGNGCAFLGSGSGGTGYINTSRLTNAHMTCYDCEESNETATKTISTECTNSTPTVDCAKEGHGHVLITFMGSN